MLPQDSLQEELLWVQDIGIPLQHVDLQIKPAELCTLHPQEVAIAVVQGRLCMGFSRPVAHEVPYLLARIVEDSLKAQEQEFVDRAFLHEMLNPLAVLSGHLELLQRDCRNVRRFNAISSSLRQMRQQLDNWQQRYRPLSPQWFVLKEVWDDVLQELAPNMAGRQVSAHYRGWRGELLSDKQRLHQILFNLMKNSMEAMSEGGELRLRVEHRAGRVEMILRDDAGGVPDHIQPYLFMPGTSSKGVGRGLGMALSLRLAESMGGKLVYDVDKGGAFVLTLPKVMEP